MSVKLDQRNPITTADALVTIEGVPGYFSNFSGVKYNVSRPQYSDGLTNIKRAAGSGSVEYEDVTLDRSFDPEVDGVLIDWCEQAKCSLEGSDITVRPVRRCDGITQRGDRAWRLSGCRLKSFESFEVDTADGDSVVMISIAFSVEQADFS